MKSTLIGGLACFVLAVVIALAQLWLQAFSAELFVKLEITLGCLLAVLVVVWFTRKEYREYRRQQDSTALDD